MRTLGTNVALFVWRDELSVGNVLLDNDHRQLINKVNELFRAMEQRKDKGVLSELLSAVIEFTREHFKLEEDLMYQMQYLELSAHKEEHDRLLREMSDMQKKFVEGKSMLSIHVSRFLNDWVFNHILHDDKELAAAIREAGHASNRLA
jgi:hemerythrin-like metal-binding protein